MTDTHDARRDGHNEEDEGDATKDTTKQSTWWWFTVQCETEDEAKMWRISETPKVKYVCWRAHAAPTTGKPHVHVLVNYVRQVRYGTLKNNQYRNIRYLTTQISKERCRDYCIEDIHKDGTAKNPIDEFREEGNWIFGAKKNGRQGERTDFVAIAQKARSHKRRADIYQDEELLPALAKYPKFVMSMYDTRPVPQPEVDMSKGIQKWQQDVITLLNEKPKKRRIIWIWSAESNTGKNEFMAYVEHVLKKTVLQAPNKFTDLLHNYDNEEVIWFDLARANDDVDHSSKNFKQILLKNIEHCSNHGTKTSPKYEGRRITMVSHVVVTSNMPPPKEDLPDRIIDIYAYPFEAQQVTDQVERTSPQVSEEDSREELLDVLSRIPPDEDI